MLECKYYKWSLDSYNRLTSTLYIIIDYQMLYILENQSMEFHRYLYILDAYYISI